MGPGPARSGPVSLERAEGRLRGQMDGQHASGEGQGF